MGMTSLSGPIRSGTIKDGSANDNTGLVVLSQSAPVTFADTTAAALFVLPAGSRIIQFNLTVLVAFNAGTNNTVDVVSDDPHVFGRTTATSAPIAIGHYTMGSAAAAAAPLINNVGTSDYTLYGIFAGTGTAADAGSGIITVSYVQRRTDGSVTPVV